MKIVVTGATGNVGTALLRRLVADNRHEITGISRRRPPSDAPYNQVAWVGVDIGRSDAVGHLGSAMDGADVVVHLAWLIQPSRDRGLLRSVNRDGTRAVITAAIQAGVGHLVHMSSVGIYAPAPSQWKDETWSTNGVESSSYSVDKAACERMLDDLDGAMTVSRVRPALILQPDAASEISRYFLGPFVPAPLVRPALLRFAPLPRGIAIQFVHADDVADALVRIAESSTPGPFNLAADPVIDRERYCALFGGVGPPAPIPLLRAAAQLAWRLRLQPIDLGWVDLGTSIPLMRCDRARSELGWLPQHPADDTLTSFIDAVRRGQGIPGPLLYRRRRFARAD